MKANELRSMQLHELDKELLSLCRTQFILRMQLATQQINNTYQLKSIKKDIARIKTIITQKKLNHDE